MNSDQMRRAKEAAAKARKKNATPTTSTRSTPSSRPATAAATPGKAKSNGQKAPPANGERPISTRKLVRECFADIRPELLTWLWPNVWLDGSLNLLTGNPGLGKTFIASHLAATITTGGKWPDGSGNAPKGDVMFMSAEDSYAAVLVHRVKAAGGDLKKVHRWRCLEVTHHDGESEEREITLEEIDAIIDDLSSLPTLKLLILDPVTSYLGTADANDNAEVRRVLKRLGDLAETNKFCVLLVTHDKKMNVAAINSPMGSTAFTAVPRVVQGLFRDPEDESKMKRLLLPIKNNHGPDRQGRSFSIRTDPAAPSKSTIAWDEAPETRSADEVKAMTAKSMAFVGREHTEEEVQKRRQVKILTVIDAAASQNDGWIEVDEIRDKTAMSGSTMKATIYQMVEAGILEERHVDKVLPKGAVVPNGQKVVRRRRHVIS